jgi:hypothetical protein
MDMLKTSARAAQEPMKRRVENQELTHERIAAKPKRSHSDQ